MALKNLTHFTEFDASRFLSRKELRFVSAKRWIEKSETGSEIEKGVKVGVLIFSDDSDYPNEKNNIGEQLTVKVPLASMKDYDSYQPMLTTVEIVDIEKAVVYGEYRNQLSLIAKVNEVVEL
ncbi:hypothetical protein MK391_08560 [Streptococcus oralis]|jgi:hypothetical protein|uniref:Uncharacterized protein n=1 Tax=Streptococcus oralis TaxID=1303 RepID=A0A4Q2FMR9_STROR|nr:MULTISPECIES: hypothetical protein [Streptococcus]ANR74811.1 hypothetical protein AXF18_02190 [Streptococcus sp. oral taxon 064]EUC79235.1 hypothetical protein HMPREF1518_0279 [Streptococcus sp. SR1]MCY7068732.1 hypothetical protein [Streptococcus oralis]MCY7095638.1 hypothetical protein [Streptococcus oralis]MDK7118262.1 hypothetical protein [Streptococcus oralis]